MNRHFSFSEGNYYYIYNNGVEDRDIFFDKDDWRHFQRLLFFRNDIDSKVRGGRSGKLVLADQPRVATYADICAYVLMPNHFKLLVREKEAGGVSKFMGKLLTSYSKYVNQKYSRKGPLMCRPFRAKQVDTDSYLRWLISSMHLSPASQRYPNWQLEGVGDLKTAWEDISTYPYSSYRDYFGEQRDETLIINKEALPFFISDLEDVGNMLAVHQGIK